MAGAIEWLVGLDRIRLGRDAPLSLQWQSPYEPWMLFCFALLLLAFVVLVHRRESSRLSLRIAAGVLRAGIIGAVIVLLCRPVLVLQQEKTEPSWVALVLDTSQSMDRHERYRGEDLAASVAAGAGLADPAEAVQHSRLELARRALLQKDAAAIRTLLVRNQVRILRFADDVQALASVATTDDLDLAVAALSDASATGTGTNLAGALADVIESEAGGRLAAVVLASDAQSTAPASLGPVVDLARAGQVPILPLRIGSPQPPQDVQVGPIVADENVFLKDLAAIRARVAVTGLDMPTPLTIRLIDESAPGQAVATELVKLGGPQRETEIEFRIKPDRTGRVAYLVQADQLPGEDETDNNVDRVELRVVEDKLRVLYVEGYPRFEYRYLKNTLLREATIESSILLLNADPEFAQEGTAPIRRFPETPAEVNAYDVVIFGDVDPTGDWLSPAQARLLVDFVADSGGGFALLAGQQYAPQRFRGTPLEKLIPVRTDPQYTGSQQGTLTNPYRPRLTVEGLHSRLFRFDPDAQVSAELFESLPGLYWTARTLGPRPGAETLAEHPALAVPTDQALPMPLMVLGRYGAGKVFFCATDDLWRWRRHTGEYLHDVFWVQLCRTLMRPADTGQDRRLRLRTDRRTYDYGQRVELRLEVEDAELLASLPSATDLALLDARGTPVARIKAERVDPASNVFEAWFAPSRPGAYTVRCDEIVPPARPTARVSHVPRRTR